MSKNKYSQFMGPLWTKKKNLPSMTLRIISQQHCIFFWLTIINTHWAALNHLRLTSHQCYIMTVLACLVLVRINYEIMFTTYNSPHKFAPNYISELFISQSTSLRHFSQISAFLSIPPELKVIAPLCFSLQPCRITFHNLLHLTNLFVCFKKLLTYVD